MASSGGLSPCIITIALVIHNQQMCLWFVPFLMEQDMQCCGEPLSVAANPGFRCFYSRVQSAGTQCLHLQLHDFIPSSFMTGKHSHWLPSRLRLMHLWAHLHRLSLVGICTSKSGSLWMNLSSCWPTTVWLQLLLRSHHCIIDYCNLFSCNGEVVLRVCWYVTTMVTIKVIMIVKVALAFGHIQWPTNIDPCIGGHIGHLLLHDKDYANWR